MTIGDRIKKIELRIKINAYGVTTATEDIEFLLYVISTLMRTREKHWQTVERFKDILAAVISKGEKAIREYREAVAKEK